MSGKIELSEQAERIYRAKANEIVRPLDKGWAWAIMISAFVCSIVVDGITYSFGMLLEDLTDAFKSTPAVVSIAGSLLASLYMCEGPVLAPVMNRFGYRWVAMIGSVLGCLAFLVANLSNDVGLFIVAYGVLGGISLGLVYLPSMIIVCQYFEKYRPIATGVSAAGSGVGMLVFAPLTKALYEWYGWRGTMLILSGLVLQTLPFCALYRELRTFYRPELHKLRKSLAASDGNSHSHSHSQRTPLLSAPSDHTPAQNGHAADNALNSDHRHSRSSLGHTQNQRSHESPARSHHGGSMGALHARRRSRGRSITDAGDDHSIGRPFDRADILFTGSVSQLQAHRDALAKSREMIAAKSSELHPAAADKQVEEQTSKLYARTVTQMTEANAPKTHSKKKGAAKFCTQTLPSALNSMFAFELLKEPSFLVMLGGNFFAFTGILIIMMYVPNYARDTGAGSQEQALLIVILGALNTSGRIFFNFLAQKLPGWRRVALHNSTAIVAGVVTLFLPLCTEYWMMCVYCAVFGLFLAPIISLTTPLLTDLFGLQNLTKTFGLMCLVRGLACLIGAPLGGIIKDATGSYSATFIVGGCLYIAAGTICCLLFVPSIKRVRMQQPGKALPENIELEAAA